MHMERKEQNKTLADTNSFPSPAQRVKVEKQKKTLADTSDEKLEKAAHYRS